MLVFVVVLVVVVVVVVVQVEFEVEEEITCKGLVIDICQQDPFAFTFTDSRLSTMKYFLSVVVWAFVDCWTCCDDAQEADMFGVVYSAIQIYTRSHFEHLYGWMDG